MNRAIDMSEKEKINAASVLILLACAVIWWITTLTFSDDDYLKTHIYSECFASMKNAPYCRGVADEIMEYRYDIVVGCNDQYNYDELPYYFNQCLYDEGVIIP